MKSISFPKMFKTNSTIVTGDFNEATKQNLNLLLKSEKGELFGDPYYGTKLKSFIFNQNSYVLKDIFREDIYLQLSLFMPQLKVNRNDITITQDIKGKLICNFKAINQLNFEKSTYSLVLYNEDTY